jgi:AraC-like DNA-binding protein
MNGVPLAFDHATDRAAFRRPAHRGGIELYQAHIVRHAFEPHTHDAYGLGAIESGVERFRYRGSEHLAPPDTLVLMNPDELHTGRAETDQGWRYRMVYLDADVLSAISGDSGWWFADAVSRDAPRARRVGALLQSLWTSNDSLAFDSRLSLLVDALRPAARIGRVARPLAAQRFAAVVDFMQSRLGDVLTLEMLAGVAGLSPFHFLREFKRAHDATPQQMLMALRLFDAKQRLAAGEPPASVAAAAGLSDQAHLTRAFVRRYGVTPGRYQQQLGTRPRPRT